MNNFEPLRVVKNRLSKKSYATVLGKVSQVVGLIIKVEGLDVFVGEVCEIEISKTKKIVLAEVVGFINKTVLLMPLDELNGIGPGCLVRPTGSALEVEINDDLLGKTLDGLGRVLTGEEISNGKKYPVDQDSISKICI